MSTENQENAATTAPKTVTVSGILADLSSGLDRAAIAAKYSLSKKEMTIVFQHPKLKGRKTKVDPASIITVVDDTESESETANTSDEAVAAGPATRGPRTARASRAVAQEEVVDQAPETAAESNIGEAEAPQEEKVAEEATEEIPTAEAVEEEPVAEKSPWDR